MQKVGFISVFALKDADLISKCVEENYVLIFYHDMGNRLVFFQKLLVIRGKMVMKG